MISAGSITQDMPLKNEQESLILDAAAFICRGIFSGVLRPNTVFSIAYQFLSCESGYDAFASESASRPWVPGGATNSTREGQ